MSELLFPLVGPLFVFLVVVPLLSLAAYLVLKTAPRSEQTLDAHTHPRRLLLIMAPTLGPIIWLLSAVAHQSEDGAALATCVVDPIADTFCLDTWLFAAVLLTVPLAAAVRGSRGSAATPCASRPVSPSHPMARRVRALCERQPQLQRWMQRVHVLPRSPVPACTRGLFRPRVELDARWAAGLTDAELLAVLLHEHEHAQALDPLRNLLGQVALAINPLGGLLARELACYHFAREAACDRRAVQRGADPLALARGIVGAANPQQQVRQGGVALGGQGLDEVRVRVQLLLDYAGCSPGEEVRDTSTPVVALCGTLAAAWPHLLGTAPLDTLHRTIEQAGLLWGLG